jgi:hypothetical protein
MAKYQSAVEVTWGGLVFNIYCVNGCVNGCYFVLNPYVVQYLYSRYLVCRSYS